VQKLGFTGSKFDNCLYVKRENKKSVYLLVFVNDLLICSSNQYKINEVKKSLLNRFSMKDLGQVKGYIGIEIKYDVSKHEMNSSQKKYIKPLCSKYKLDDSKLYKTPMETNLKIEQAKEIDESIKYRNLIGELLYISSGTRPDIAYSVNYLSRFKNCFDKTHYKYAMRILKYLIDTKDVKLRYKKNLIFDKTDCFVDSDFAGHNVNQKPRSGYVITLNGNVIFWKSQKQNVITKSSTFAEYVAISEAVTKIQFLRNLYNKTFYLKIKNQLKFIKTTAGL